MQRKRFSGNLLTDTSEQKGEEMPVTINVDELKNAQEEIKKQLEEIDTQITQKETRGEVNYDIIETKSLVKKLIKENEKIAQKIDYLLAILAEAAEQTEDTSVLDSVKTLLKTQMEVINYLSKIAEKDFNIDLSPVINSMESLRTEVNSISQNILKLMDRLPESSQIELLKTKLDEVYQKLNNIETTLNTPKEVHLPEIHDIHRELQELKNESEIVSSKLNQLIEMSRHPDYSQEILEKINTLAGKMNLLEAEIVRKKELIEKMNAIEDEIQNILKNYQNVGSSSFDEVIRKLESIRNEIPRTETTQMFHEKLEQITNKIIAYKKRKENSEKINQVLSDVEFSIQEGNMQKLEEKLQMLEELLGMDKEAPIIRRIEELEDRIEQLLQVKEQMIKEQTPQPEVRPLVQKVEELHEQTVQEKTQVESKFSIVEEFINQMSPGMSISIPELAEKLGMDIHELEDYLIDLSHRRNDIKLKNFGFLAKLLHKKHTLVKVKAE